MSRRLWNGIWATELVTGNGHRALITDHGAHVVSWAPAGEERLFLSERSKFGGSASIRGGVPIIFPQFNQRGPGMRHGFARIAEWKLVDSGDREGGAFARYALTQAVTGAFGWTQAFLASYEVVLSADGALSMTLRVSNQSDEPLSFTAALHTYLQVSDIADVRIGGLRGVNYADFTDGGTIRLHDAEYLDKVDNVDYIFANVPGQAALKDASHVVTSSQSGFVDMVVWNPGAEIAKSMADLHEGGDRRFVCMEAATVEQPVVLAPGQEWAGTQRLSVSS